MLEEELNFNRHYPNEDECFEYLTSCRWDINSARYVYRWDQLPPDQQQTAKKWTQTILNEIMASHGGRLPLSLDQMDQYIAQLRVYCSGVS
jgi:hypothetical protein